MYWISGFSWCTWLTSQTLSTQARSPMCGSSTSRGAGTSSPSAIASGSSTRTRETKASHRHLQHTAWLYQTQIIQLTDYSLDYTTEKIHCIGRKLQNYWHLFFVILHLFLHHMKFQRETRTCLTNFNPKWCVRCSNLTPCTCSYFLKKSVVVFCSMIKIVALHVLWNP